MCQGGSGDGKGRPAASEAGIRRRNLGTLLRERNQNLLLQADLVAEIEKLQDDLRNERDRNLRTLADFKNYRRRVEREGDKLAGEGKRSIILPLLDIIDDLERGLLSAGDESRPFAAGVRIILQKLLSLLEATGVRRFESAGMPFDPARHDAVAMRRSGDSQPGTVVDVLRPGYLWNNELLRPAQVRVAE